MRADSADTGDDLAGTEVYLHLDLVLGDLGHIEVKVGEVLGQKSTRSLDDDLAVLYPSLDCYRREEGEGKTKR